MATRGLSASIISAHMHKRFKRAKCVNRKWGKSTGFSVTKDWREGVFRVEHHGEGDALAHMADYLGYLQEDFEVEPSTKAPCLLVSGRKEKPRKYALRAGTVSVLLGREFSRSHGAGRDAAGFQVWANKLGPGIHVTHVDRARSTYGNGEWLGRYAQLLEPHFTVTFHIEHLVITGKEEGGADAG